MSHRRAAQMLASTLAVTAMTLAACSTNDSPTTKNTAASGAKSAASGLKGSIAFNDDNLAKLRDQLKQALAGKDVTTAKVAVVVNVTAAYWTAARAGVTKAAKELGVDAVFQEPTTQDIGQQLSIVNTLLSQGRTGFSISAIQPSSLSGAIGTAARKHVNMIAIDSPLTRFKDQAPLYLGTPNFEAGQNAGNAMKKLLPGGGDVAILVGSLTATNATQRIAGFKDAVKGSKIKVFQTYNDNGDANRALQNASAAMQADPGLKGMYGVYSYDGPSAGQAVQSTGRSGKVVVVADDAEPKTLTLLKQGAIEATVLQQPYQQGYMSVYILTAMKVLGEQATLDIIKPYLDTDGYTLS
ncbi:MAG TPA: substrate-binding domain-containing protein, partial [Mycobacteriales bacterium]|nr:substrate-binding domain-containing protein [Mycobacteriales bacterium]